MLCSSASAMSPPTPSTRTTARAPQLPPRRHARLLPRRLQQRRMPRRRHRQGRLPPLASSATIPPATTIASPNRSSDAASISPSPNRACSSSKPPARCPTPAAAASRPDSEYYNTLLTLDSGRRARRRRQRPHRHRHLARPRQGRLLRQGQRSSRCRWSPSIPTAPRAPSINLALYLTNNKSHRRYRRAGRRHRRQARRHLRLRPLRQVHRRRRDHRAAADGNFKWPKLAAEQLHRRPGLRQAEESAHPAQRARAPTKQFLRRVYLDLIGLPAHRRGVRTVHGGARDRDKRAKLVDRLLARDEFADLWATNWAEMLKIRSRQQQLPSAPTARPPTPTTSGFASRCSKNTPLDQFVRAQVAGTGSNLRESAGQSLHHAAAGPVRCQGSGAGCRAGLHRHARAVRAVPQPPLRSLDAGRLLRLRQLLHRREAQGGHRSARVLHLRRSQRRAGQAPARRPPGAARNFWAATRPTSRAKIRASRSPTGSRRRTTRCSARTWPIASGRSSSAAASSTRWTTCASAIRPAIANCCEELGQHLADYNFDAEAPDPRHLHFAHLPAFRRPQRHQSR